MSSFNRLVKIMDELREKCPWDRKQTIHSLRQMTIEETYELGDAVLDEDWPGVREELGDLLLHVVFYAKIADEQKQFDIEQVIEGICEKLIKRHPHIYAPQLPEGLQAIRNEDDVKKNWEQIKLQEGKKSVLGGVPRSLPAVTKAMRLQEKAAQVGFDWDDIADVWGKVSEETAELQDAVSQDDKQKQEEELGDLMFALINYARFLNIDAEAAIERTNKKFMRRFQKIEAFAAANNKNLKGMTLEEMDSIWNSAKKEE
ncbi:MAG: nucleoside triphosphate pyrophosphohydrolase [Niabella sp.]